MVNISNKNHIFRFFEQMTKVPQSVNPPDKGHLSQPIDAAVPEPGHDPKQVIGLQKFIALLQEEEEYWAPDQNNTRLMISRLRKIFYDQWGWNSELIRGAAQVESRYITAIKSNPVEHGREFPQYSGLIYTPVYRVVTYTDHDRVYGSSRAGQIPFIYNHDHQDVQLPAGDFCDLGHVLAGLDALNYRQVVSPLPSFLSFLAKLLPHVDSNVDIVTWLGDLASASADFLFDYLKDGHQRLNTSQEEHVIEDDASASDMIGDIEPYVIAHHYAIGSTQGQRVTTIFDDYFNGAHGYRAKRYSTFASLIGLVWDGHTFSNEKSWIHYYHRQLKNSVCFVTFSQNEKTLSGLLLPLKIWFGGYSSVLQMDLLLKLFLKTLTQKIKLEN